MVAKKALATVSRNRICPTIGFELYVQSLPMLPEDLFYATYVEQVVEKEARSIQNNPPINHDQPP
jgi:hypothetical protein